MSGAGAFASGASTARTAEPWLGLAGREHEVTLRSPTRTPSHLLLPQVSARSRPPHRSRPRPPHRSPPPHRSRTRPRPPHCSAHAHARRTAHTHAHACRAAHANALTPRAAHAPTPRAAQADAPRRSGNASTTSSEPSSTSPAERAQRPDVQCVRPHHPCRCSHHTAPARPPRRLASAASQFTEQSAGVRITPPRTRTFAAGAPGLRVEWRVTPRPSGRGAAPLSVRSSYCATRSGATHAGRAGAVFGFATIPVHCSSVRRSEAGWVNS